MIGGACAQSNLPACQGNDPSRWTNCTGSFTSQYGNKFLGEFQNGLRNGQGTLVFSDGSKYVGEFKNNDYNGKGIIYAPNGSISKEGMWTEGKLTGENNLSRQSMWQVTQSTSPSTVNEKIRSESQIAKEKQAELKDPTEACLSNLPSQKELQILKGKVVLGYEPPSLEILSNTKKPNQLEKNALLALDRLIDQCKSQGKDWRIRNYPPSLNSIIDSSFFSNYKFLLADLYAGKLIYGDFAKKRQEIGTEFNIAISNENSRSQKNIEIENSNLQREQQRKQGELEQQKLYQKQQECRTTNQQIMEAVRALNQAKAQQQANAQYQAQRNAEMVARMSPGEFGASMLYQGASQLGNGLGQALGAEDPLQAQDRRIQDAIQQYKSACER